MSLHVEQNYANGIPQTAIDGGMQAYGICEHWTAGGTGRAGAEATVRHFQNTRYTVNASYHILVWVEHEPGHVGCRTYAMWIVPPRNAAHSVNPGTCWKYHPDKSRAVQDARFAEVRRILGPKASDPNAGMIAVSHCGMPADLARDAECPVFIADKKTLVSHLRMIPTMNPRPLFGHGWIQPATRYELDSQAVGGVDLLISKLYTETPQPAPTPTGADMKFTNPIVHQRWTTKAGPSSEFVRPDGTLGHFTESEEVESIAEGVLTADVPGAAYLKAGRPVRLLDYGPNHEALVINRWGMDPVHGTRTVGQRPVSADDGVTQADVNAAVNNAVDAIVAAANTLKR